MNETILEIEDMTPTQIAEGLLNEELGLQYTNAEYEQVINSRNLEEWPLEVQFLHYARATKYYMERVTDDPRQIHLVQAAIQEEWDGGFTIKFSINQEAVRKGLNDGLLIDDGINAGIIKSPIYKFELPFFLSAMAFPKSVTSGDATFRFTPIGDGEYIIQRREPTVGDLLNNRIRIAIR